MKQCSLKKAGRIHSLESFGTHEGPGIRYVVFLQGCAARCLYCHNPDTWDINSGKPMSPSEVFKKIKRCLPYINSSKGGVTVSGGEPLLQLDFLIGLFRLCRKSKIHTAIDTAGFYPKNIDKKKLNSLIKLTDLFIVDIKATDQKLHKKLTSRELKEAMSFVNMLEEGERPYWIRYVLVPGVNDSIASLKSLGKTLSRLQYCTKFEFLPYHTLGVHKWKSLGLKYALNRVSTATVKDIERAISIVKFKRSKSSEQPTK